MLPKEDYEQLLISYGPYLRCAGFYDMMEEKDEFESMSRIIPQCPNVEFTVLLNFYTFNDSLIPALNRMAQHISKIELKAHEEDTNWEMVEGFANRLNKVKSVRSSCRNSKMLDAMFATPKLSLQELHLFHVNLSLNQATAGKMRSSVTKLWLFTFPITGRNDVELFESLLAACLNLRPIHFFFPCSKMSV